LGRAPRRSRAAWFFSSGGTGGLGLSFGHGQDGLRIGFVAVRRVSADTTAIQPNTDLAVSKINALGRRMLMIPGGGYRNWKESVRAEDSGSSAFPGGSLGTEEGVSERAGWSDVELKVLWRGCRVCCRVCCWDAAGDARGVDVGFGFTRSTRKPFATCLFVIAVRLRAGYVSIIARR